MDIQTEILLVGSVTLAFVVGMEVTIVTVSWRGLRLAQDLQRKLRPITQVLERLTPDQIAAGAKRLQDWFESSEDFNARLKKEGL